MSNLPGDTLPKALCKELELARFIQQSTYPSRIPAIEGYKILGDTEPAMETFAEGKPQRDDQT
ncbi:MAG: hypothetical protein H6974_16495, partial [Gammaproteobacteria bacterium]|nr:hypothetical protein [Gammaproteobacteria bacterium]